MVRRASSFITAFHEMAQAQNDSSPKAVADLERRLAEDQRARGLASFRRRRFGEAALAFGRCAEDAADDVEARYLLARAHLLARDHNAARLACQRALEQAPDCYRGHLLMTRIALSSRNKMLAQAHLQKALALRPRSADLHARLAELLAARSQFRKARELAEAARALDANCFAARVVIARCQIAMGQLKVAQALLSKLESERPSWPSVIEARGLLDLRLNSKPAGRPAADSPPTATDHGVRPTPQEAPAAFAPEIARHPVPADPVPAEPSGEDAMRPPPQARTEPNDAVTARALKALWSAPGVLGHLFIIKALIIRNLRMNYGRNPIRILTELARPTAVIVAHYVLFWILRRPMPGNVPIIVFVLGGFSVWFAFNAAETGASTGAKHAGGIFALNGVTGMHLRSAKAFWPFLVTLTYCLLAPVVLNFYGSDLSPPNLISTCAIFGVTGAFGFGFGLLFERMNQLWSGVKILEKLLIWVIFVSMGLYFSVAHMRPPILARIMLYNPLLHLVEYERHAFDPAYPISQLSLLYPALFAAITLFLGLAAVKCLPAED